jgi:TonB dependent receptor
MNNYTFQANLTKVLNQHSVKFGGEFRVVQLNTFQTGDASNDFSFTSAFTQGPVATQATSTGGNALATFLLGYPNGSVTPSAALALQTRYYAGFVQDDWKVTPSFTLNLGVRYELETPRTDRFNQLTNFDYYGAPGITVAGLNLHGGLTFVGVNGQSRYDGNFDKNNFAPRIGFAWHVSPKTVIRAGTGLFYGTTWGFGAQPSQFGISGFTAATNLVSSLNGVTPIVSLSNPYPSGLNAATRSRLGRATLLGQDISFFDRGNVTPYTMQWNADIQQQLPGNFLLDVAYIGTRGLKLILDRQINQLPDSALTLGNDLLTLVPNPFYGQIATGVLASPTVSRAQLLRPYPQYTSMTSAVSTWDSSSYHALQVKLEKRYSKDLTMLVSYTYSKLMDIGAGTFNGETLSGGTIQDWNNLGAEWSPSALDQTHRLIASFVYALPFFRSQTGFLPRILGGWELGAIGSFYSGSPLGISSAVNGTFSQGGGQRPNWNGINPGKDQPTLSEWFNTSAFSTPVSYTFGTAPRTFNSVRSDKTQTVDLSLHKNVKINERFGLQVRGEAFNVANTPVFAPPGTSFGSATFGVVNSQANQPRIVQLALKLNF